MIIWRLKKEILNVNKLVLIAERVREIVFTGNSLKIFLGDK